MQKFIMLATLTFLFLTAAIYPQRSVSGVIETNITPEMAEIGCTLRLSGLIEAGDADRLESYLAVAPSIENDYSLRRPYSPAIRFGFPVGTHRLCLNSPGGNFLEAIEIAERLGGYIDEYDNSGVLTGVASGDSCFSACSIIFMGGRYSWVPSQDSYWEYDRILHPNGRLGFHATFLNLEDRDYSFAEVRDIQEVNAVAVSRLMSAIGRGAVNMNSQLLTDMFATNAPDLIYVETLGQASLYDIAVEPIPVEIIVSQTIASVLENQCNHAALRATGYISIQRRGSISWELTPGEPYAGQVTISAISSESYHATNVNIPDSTYSCRLSAGTIYTTELQNFDAQSYLLSPAEGLIFLEEGRHVFRPSRESLISFGNDDINAHDGFPHEMLPVELDLISISNLITTRLD